MVPRRLLALPILVFAVAVGGAILAQCTCNEATRHNGWCDVHGVGYVAGVKITSGAVFHALDAHGHHVPSERLHCDTCLEAHDAGNGFCETHRIGWVDSQAYLSPLTYYLARGRPVDPAGIDCPICGKNAESHGWCASCNVGHVGHVVIEDRKEFEELERVLRILHTANETALRCETCAAVMILDGTCSKCKITYKDGKKVDAESP